LLALLFLLVFLVPAAMALPHEIPIASAEDDGEELADLIWNPDASPLCLGRVSDPEVHDLGLRFVAPGLIQADSVLFARLRFSSRGGEISDSLTLVVTGALETDSPPLSQARRPSLLPRTQNRIVSTVTEPWIVGGTNQIFYYTEDISGIINEIISQPGWGDGSAALVICLDDSSTPGTPHNYLACSELAPTRWPVVLQICRSLAETFHCPEILGRPTDHSVTVSFASLVSLEVYVEYGAGGLTDSTTPLVVPAGEPCEVELTGLASDTAYSYRLRYRPAGTGDLFAAGAERFFHTQRSPGSSFSFTIQADSHIWDFWGSAAPDNDYLKLYEQTLQNVAADEPDFHISLGDFSLTEYSRTWPNALDRYLTQRRYLGEVLHSIPFYLVIGNHEGELGWFQAQGDSVPVWAERARRLLVPNPYPDGFYDGCPDPPATGTGFRESYYSWEWGDALFVVLDPYWYTTSAPFHNPNPELGGGWAWTLGQDQYNWLHQVLTGTDRTWKILLLHHLVGGIVNGINDAYGRGGTETVKWNVAHKPTFEWGGEDQMGLQAFAAMRPGWEHGPIHDLLVATGVDLVIHGHDHFCAIQQHDSIVYLECPLPNDAEYTFGFRDEGGYNQGTLLPNSGHVRFLVTPDNLTLEYMRAFLAGGGTNGSVEFSFTFPNVTGQVAAPIAVAPQLRIFPNPASGPTTMFLHDARGGATLGVTDLSIYDVAGRLRARLLPLEDGSFVWNQRDSRGRSVPSGVYYVATEFQGGKFIKPVVVLR